MYPAHLSVDLLRRMKSSESKRNVDATICADCILCPAHFSAGRGLPGSEVPFVGRREEKPGSSAFDSRFLSRSMLLRVIAPCKVMIISEMLLFIKWAWIFYFFLNLYDRHNFQDIRAIILC